MATDKLGDIRLFIEAATQGSLSAAGRKLGFSAAAASMRLTKLEASLQTKLFDRTTRLLRLTDEGRMYLDHCQVALKGLADVEEALHAGQRQVRGKIRVSASTDFGRNILNPWLEEFCGSYPQLQLALTLTDSLSKLVEDNIDIAIRFGKPQESDLVACLLAPSWRVLCAAPSYLEKYGTPQTPEDLQQHRFIVLMTANGPLSDYQFSMANRLWTRRIALEQAWETNDGALATQWALSGWGITRKTIWDAAGDLRSGRLQLVLPEYTVDEPGIYAIFHRNRYQVSRVRTLLDFLQERFREASRRLLDDLPGPLSVELSRWSS